MAVIDEDWKTTLELLAGWEPQWDEAAVTVNGVLCMKRDSLLQLLRDNLQAKTTAYEILRRLVEVEAVQPARMTSRKDRTTGEKVSFLTHEIVTSRCLYELSLLEPVTA